MVGYVQIDTEKELRGKLLQPWNRPYEQPEPGLKSTYKMPNRTFWIIWKHGTKLSFDKRACPLREGHLSL